MSFRDNFTGLWNLWKYGIVKRDYSLLDEIHPNRIRSAEQWLEERRSAGTRAGEGRPLGEGSIGELDAVSKSVEDMRTGKL